MPFGWIARAEKIFEVKEIHGFDKVQWTFMSLNAWTYCGFVLGIKKIQIQPENPSTGLIRRFGGRNSSCQEEGAAIERYETYKQNIGEMIKQERVQPLCSRKVSKGVPYLKVDGLGGKYAP